MELRIFVEPQQGATYDDQLAVALKAEELGFGAFFRSDHYLAMGVDGRPGPTDSWVTLAGLARETSTIRLGTMMTSATFRHPGPLAISVAQVDQMSGGRVELGIGAGWYDAEHTAYAIPFPPTRERFDMLEDQLAILTGLWATPEGETFSYDGVRHSVTDSPGLPKPAQRPRAAREPGVRRRWPRATPTSSTCPSWGSTRPRPSWPGSARPVRRSGATPRRSSAPMRTPSAAGATRPSSSAGPP
jgi:alkanesulfonate monooxygenase SsuD/methylene tetrahydromethanopterin reductase-like flavin-dependent oxidoreductase (luciferase family)